MLRNYLKTVLRFMMKQKGLSLINVTGLTIGIACSLLILLYIDDEWRYDRFHPDGDRIFRVGFEGLIQGAPASSAQTGFPVAHAIARTHGVESTLRMACWRTFPVKYNERTFTEEYLVLADPNFFRFFSFSLVAGHPDSVLLGKGNVVISESAARRYFDYTGQGDHSAVIGRTLAFAQGYKATVTGIAKDPPANSHFHFSLVLSLDSWEPQKEENEDWVAGRVYTYFKLLPDAPRMQTCTRISLSLEEGLGNQLRQRGNTDLETFRTAGNALGYFFQPLHDIHLTSGLRDEIEVNGSMTTCILFALIALFITALACINFMNLTTAQSATRAKEIAVRKTAGASNDKLMRQFLLESCLYAGIGVVLALLVVAMVLPAFNFLTSKQLLFTQLLKPGFVAGVLLFIAVTGLVAGSYPALYLTRFNPVDVMKGNLRARIRTYGIRNVLVVFQFFISVSLIIATLVVYQQLSFLRKANVGFDKSNIINLLHTLNLGDQHAFKEALLASPGVISASYSNRIPPNISMQSVIRSSASGQDYLFVLYEMDADHLQTMGYRMVSGRFFDKSTPDDIHAVILNETGARKLGITDFHGTTIITDPGLPSEKERRLIGIMQDFHYQSLKDPIQPMAIILGSWPFREMAIRVGQEDRAAAVASLRKLWDKYAPDAAFEYSFVEGNFDSQQTSEKRSGLLFLIFTVLAIAIACLGLFGLATFTTEQKRKQIGIRKVLGASAGNIVLLLNMEFLRLVFIANLLAWPFTWWIMNKWLDRYAYHTGIPWWTFVLAGCITFLIALLSISYRSFAAASGNPVDSLRSE